MKKLVSFLLCGIMVFSSSISIFANDEGQQEDNSILIGERIEQLAGGDALNNSDQAKIIDDINFLANAGLDIASVQEIEIKNDSIAYTYLLDNGIESDIKISKKNNGNKVFNVSEDGKTDEIIIDSSGKVYSDGIEVKLESSVKDDKLEQRNVQKRSIISNTMDCPRGTASDYTDYDGNISNSNVKLSKRLASYTVTGFSILLAGLSGTAFLAGISYAVAGEIIYDFAGLAPDTTYLSYESEIYAHKDGAYYGTIYKKYITKWYSEKNFGGEKTKVISYRMTEYN